MWRWFCDVPSGTRIMETSMDFWRIGPFDWRAMSWSAIIAGVVAALVLQIMLIMLGIGIGLVATDASTATTYSLGVSWAAFLWWMFSGILAAFVGGWVAATVANTPNAGPVNALMAWALAVLIVIGATAFTAGTTASMATNLAGPNAMNLARLNAVSERSVQGTTGQRAATATREVEAARKALAAGMLASFFALLLGASAAFAGGWVAENDGFAERRTYPTTLP
jgi:hypothetical protein